MGRATVRDVAKSAGVSVATVSRVLNGTKRVLPDAKRRVEEAIVALRYSPSNAAKSLRLSKAQALGLVLPGLENPFFPSLIEQAARAAEGAGYSLLIRLSSTPLATAAEMSHGQHVDGIVVVGHQGAQESMDEVGPSLVPLVAFDRLPCDSRLPLFQVANRDGAALVVAHLLERCSGDVELLHIEGPIGLDVSIDRACGVTEAVERVRRQGRQVELFRAGGDFSERSGFEVAEEHLRRFGRPSAIFAANDLMAIGAIRAAQLKGFHVGTEVLVAGFDGLEVGGYVTPSLTTYRQPIAHISLQAVQHLIALVEGVNKTSTPKIERFEGELLVRDSTGGADV